MWVCSAPVEQIKVRGKQWEAAVPVNTAGG